VSGGDGASDSGEIGGDSSSGEVHRDFKNMVNNMNYTAGEVEILANQEQISN
jgi:hypothetical protein